MLDFDQLISFHLRLRDYVKENPYNQTTAKKNPYSHWRIISNIGSENSAVMFKNNRLNKWNAINGKTDYQQWLNLSSDSNWLPLTNDISNICLVDEWTMMNDKQHQWHFLHFTALVHDLIVQLNTFFMHDYEFWIAFPCSIIRGEIGKITWQSFFSSQISWDRAFGLLHSQLSEVLSWEQVDFGMWKSVQTLQYFPRS